MTSRSYPVGFLSRPFFLNAFWHLLSYCLLAFVNVSLAQAIPLPEDQNFFPSYTAVSTTKIGNTAATSYPIAVAAAATESGNVHLHVRTGKLEAPMDAYFGLIAQPLFPDTLFILSAGGTLSPLNAEIKPWKTSVTEIDQEIFGGFALNSLPEGEYTFYLMLTPAGNSNPLLGNYYLWSTTMALTPAKDLAPPENALLADKSTILMGDLITLSHPSIEQGKTITVHYDDGSGLHVETSAVPSQNGKVQVVTPPLMTENAPYLRSGAVNIGVQGIQETTSIFIIKPPELEHSKLGDITLQVLQFSLENLESALGNIASLDNEEQILMSELVDSIQTQKLILLDQMAQIDAIANADPNTTGTQELAMVDRLVLTHLLSTGSSYLSGQTKQARNGIFAKSGHDNLDEINRRIADIRENAHTLAENTLNAIKNVGLPGTKVLVNGITVGLTLVAITTTSTPVALAAGGTAAFVVVIQTTGLFTTTLVLEPTIDAVKGRLADLGQAASDALDVLIDGLTSISLTQLGQIEWQGADVAVLLGLSKRTANGLNASVDLLCNTEQPKAVAKALDSDFCTLNNPIEPSNLSGIWSTTYGTMTFPDSIFGTLRAPYTNDEGRIIGSLQGNNLTGHWVEKGSAVKCDSPLDGSFHWGKVDFTFNTPFTEFNGVWGYCEANPTRSWNGTKQ